MPSQMPNPLRRPSPKLRPTLKLNLNPKPKPRRETEPKRAKMKTMMIHTKFLAVRRCLALAAAVIAARPATAGLAQAPAAGDSPDPLPAETTTDHRPKKFTALRYRSIYSNSAFEREILPPDKARSRPPPTPFDLKIVSVAGKDGRYRVVLIDKKGKYQVVTDTPDADGFHYTDIEPSPKIQDFRVQVS